MKIHELVQGSPEWHAHRRQYFNASDAPAMMGCSPYKTRTQLLHEMHTGVTQDVDATMQRRFDDGHRFEALARPYAEGVIGEDLYPVVGTDLHFSASFDGLTMDESTAFEHKTLNADLHRAFNEMTTINPTPRETEDHQNCLALAYRFQMEQQCMVSGAGRVLFMASKWDGDELIEERHCWYVPDGNLRAALVAGWAQFEIDLAAYVPAEAAPVAIGRAPETLPALRIEVTGMVTASNLADFKNRALTVFGGINRELSTDAQFADAEKTVKWCTDVEERLAAAKQHALSQTESIDALFRTIDDISAEARKVRLELAGLVKVRKEAIRGELVAGGVTAQREHIEALNTRLGKPYMPSVQADFAGVIKGKRTVDSLRDAVNTELAKVKIEASAIADKIQINLGTLRELSTAHAFLFADTSVIVLKAPDDLTMLVKSRIAEHQAAESKKEEATRELIRAEEQTKAEAAARLLVEQEKQATFKAHEEAQATLLASLASASALLAVPAAPAPTANVLPMRAPVRAIAPTTAPTLKLGQIGERLGFSLTGDFLKNLGFEPAARDKSALLFHESSFTHICAALVDHINNIQTRQAA